MISQDIVTQVKELTDLVEVVSDFVTLKRKGQNLVSPCPFHQEKTPSFVVSPTKGIYKCFGCGKSGDAIQFIMDIEGLTYMDTIRYLARKYDIELKEEIVDYSTDQQREKESILIALHFATAYFQDILWKNLDGNSIGLSYFKERGLSESIIKKFQLGYSLDEWDAFLRYAISTNIVFNSHHFPPLTSYPFSRIIDLSKKKHIHEFFLCTQCLYLSFLLGIYT